MNTEDYNFVEHFNVTDLDDVQSEFVTGSTGIDFSQISSDTNGKGIY